MTGASLLEVLSDDVTPALSAAVRPCGLRRRYPVLWMSATAGQDPTELAYLAPLLAQVTASTRPSVRDLRAWLAS